MYYLIIGAIFILLGCIGLLASYVYKGHMLGISIISILIGIFLVGFSQGYIVST